MPQKIEARLRDDKAHAIKAVCVVHNETSTGCVSNIAAVRRAIDAAGHPALLMVDTISSLASIDYRHDEWGVDVTVGGSQKGLDAAAGALLQRDRRQGAGGGEGREAAEILLVVGRDDRQQPQRLLPLHAGDQPALCARPRRSTCCTRKGSTTCSPGTTAMPRRRGGRSRAWGLEVWCREPADYSSSLTAVLMPEGHDADAFRKSALEHFDISLGTGLSKIAGKVFRIGHLGDTNDLTIVGALSGVEMGLGARRRAASHGRRAGRDGLPGVGGAAPRAGCSRVMSGD